MQKLPVESPQPSKVFNTEFCLQIANHVGLIQANKGLNSVLSPISIHLILSLVAAGSKGNTLNQLLSILKSETIDHLNSLSSQLVTLLSADGSENGGPQLSFANGVWVERSFPLKPTFQEIAATIFRADARAVDFLNKAEKLIKEVNTWVENKTNCLIKDLLPPGSLDDSTMLVLGNALHFKGAWKYKFDLSSTQEREFYLLDGSTVCVPFMTNRKKQFIRSFDGFKVLKLPYEHGYDDRLFAMYIFLPNERDGLPNLIEKAISKQEFLQSHLPLHEVGVGAFWVPRFKMLFQFEASTAMKELGLVLPFSDDAELTEMVEFESNHEVLAVSDVFHKSFVEVNEEGTEAAAATKVRVIRRCSSGGSIIRPVNFVADHPFMFMILEELSGVVFFIGNVVNPSFTG